MHGFMVQQCLEFRNNGILGKSFDNDIPGMKSILVPRIVFCTCRAIFTHLEISKHTTRKNDAT
jgi:hypothetical protein